MLKALPFNENLDHLHNTFETNTFYMFKYKTCWCPNLAIAHDFKKCIYAHHMRDFRRPPEIFNYSQEECEHTQGR